MLMQRAPPVLALVVALAASSALAAVCFVDDFSSGASRLLTEPCDEPGVQPFDEPGLQPFAVAEYSLYDPFHGSRGGKYLTNSSAAGAFCAVTSRRLPVREGVRVSVRMFPHYPYGLPWYPERRSTYCELGAFDEANQVKGSISIMFRDHAAWTYAEIYMYESSNISVFMKCAGFDSESVFAIDNIKVIDPEGSYCEVMFPESATATPAPNTNTTMIPPTEVCKKSSKVVTTTVTTHEWAPENGSCGCGPSP